MGRAAPSAEKKLGEFFMATQNADNWSLSVACRVSQLRARLVNLSMLVGMSENVNEHLYIYMGFDFIVC